MRPLSDSISVIIIEVASGTLFRCGRLSIIIVNDDKNMIAAASVIVRLVIIFVFIVFLLVGVF